MGGGVKASRSSAGEIVSAQVVRRSDLYARVVAIDVANITFGAFRILVSCALSASTGACLTFVGTEVIAQTTGETLAFVTGSGANAAERLIVKSSSSGGSGLGEGLAGEQEYGEEREGSFHFRLKLISNPTEAL